MKTIMVLIIALMMASLLYAEGFDGICPKCKEEGRTSYVYPGSCFSTAMNCGGGYYDEQGKFNPPKPCNQTTCYYDCSNGHTFTAEPGDIWNKKELVQTLGR